MHINYFRFRDKKGYVNKILSRKRIIKECGICETSSNKVKTQWIKGPGGYDLCNLCGLKYLQVLAMEDQYKINPEYLNKVSPMIYIKIIFIISHKIPISKLKQIFLTLYESLNCLTGMNSDFFLLIDGYSYLKVKNNNIKIYR